MEQASAKRAQARAPIQAGDRYGRLVAIAPTHLGRRLRWLFKCDCGSERSIRMDAVRCGKTQSCGCLQRERAALSSTRHGHHRRSRRSPEYYCWAAMIQRCTNSNCDHFPNYGDRGITVCERWRSFSDFYADVGSRPTPKHTLERLDNDRGYEPGNVVWATRAQQTRNNRRTRLVAFQGRQMCLSDACALAGVPYATAHRRLMLGWPIERVFKPAQKPREVHEASNSPDCRPRDGGS